MSGPIRLAGSDLGPRAHVCAFFHHRDEEYDVLLPFIKEGLELGEKAVHTIDPHRHEQHRDRLKSAGIDVDSTLASGQLEVRDWSSTHLRNGRFDRHGTLELFQSLIRKASRAGFPRARFVTHMEWALEAELDANALLEYEAMANESWMRDNPSNNPVICSYDLNRFSGDVVVDVLRTHPMVIIGGRLRENPFFLPPDEFLEELHGRQPAPLKRVG